MNGAKATYYAHGKLLLTGEYLVLDGALSLALPTRFGQHLDLYDAGPGAEGQLYWISLDPEGEPWFAASFSVGAPEGEAMGIGPGTAFRIDFDGGEPQSERPFDPAVAGCLAQLLRETRKLDPNFDPAGLRVVTRLEFPRHWGLGSSSTLVSLIAMWAGVDPFALQFAVFGGSGYDIACALAPGPIFYRKVLDEGRWDSVDFDPPFASHLHFVHLNRKQDSRESIAGYRSRRVDTRRYLNTIVHLSVGIRDAQTLHDFEQLLQKHESVVAVCTGMEPAGRNLFPDFPGTIKSLGAWGGDFVLAASSLEAGAIREWFAGHGYSTVLSWDQMIYQGEPEAARKGSEMYPSSQERQPSAAKPPSQEHPPSAAQTS